MEQPLLGFSITDEKTINRQTDKQTDSTCGAKKVQRGSEYYDVEFLEQIFKPNSTIYSCLKCDLILTIVDRRFYAQYSLLLQYEILEKLVTFICL